MRLVDIDKAIEIWKDKDFIRLVGQEEKAKEMLNLLPTVEMTEDCVSREAVITEIEDEDRLSFMGCFCSHDAAMGFRETIKELPSVQPLPKMGKWIRAYGEDDLDIWKCDQCGCVIFSRSEYDRKKYHSWCGMCGAKMDADMEEVE